MLAAIGALPKTDPLWVAGSVRLDRVLEQAGDDTRAAAEILGVSTRGAQRLRVLYGVQRTPGWVAGSHR